MCNSVCCIFLIYNTDKQLQAEASRQIHPKGQAAWKQPPEVLSVARTDTRVVGG